MSVTETEIIECYAKSLDKAKEELSKLEVANGRKPGERVLNGWVFEQTILFYLSKDLEADGLHPKIQEQVSLFGRVKVDLLVGKVAIEIKAGGIFGLADADRYKKYRSKVEDRGWVYFYLTQQESHAPYKQATIDAFGYDRAFFLDTKGDWARFVKAVKSANRS